MLGGQNCNPSTPVDGLNFNEQLPQHIHIKFYVDISYGDWHPIAGSGLSYGYLGVSIVALSNVCLLFVACHSFNASVKTVSGIYIELPLRFT